MVKRKNPSERPKGFVIRRTTGQHAHNLFLQSWYELGVFGVILAAIAGAAVALRILLLPAAAQAYGAACFTMVRQRCWGHQPTARARPRLDDAGAW